MEELVLDLEFAEELPQLDEAEERPLRLSYSSISTYELCPLQYRFKYVDRAEGVRTPALAFGESLHEALRLFHQQPVPVAPSLGQLLGYLQDVWDGSAYSDAGEERTYKDHARQVLSAYHRANAKRFVMPVAIEQRFELSIGDVKVTGIIDRMDRHADGSYEIIDYKTNRKLPPRRIVERDLQLSIYHLAAQEVWGITPSYLTMYYVLPGQRITTTRTAEDAAQTRDRIAAVAERIAAADFAPKENRLCDWCDFKARCPLFVHAARRVEQHDPPNVAASVEEWITIKRRIRADTRRLAELTPAIDAYLDAEGIERVYGDDAAITRTRLDRGGYDTAVLDEMLANGLPEDVKEQLRAARADRTVPGLALTEPRRRR